MDDLDRVPARRRRAELRVRPRPTRRENLSSIDIVANGFLYNMVRTIAGTLIRVGERKWDAANVRQILEASARPQAGPTGPRRAVLYLRPSRATASDGP